MLTKKALKITLGTVSFKVTRVAFVGGLDSSAGAGLTRDALIAWKLGVQPQLVATALTIQTDQQVFDVWPVPLETFKKQLEQVLTLGVHSFKIGLLPTLEHLKCVTLLIKQFNLQNCVCDPVFASSSQFEFTNQSIIEAYKTELFPVCHLITPNLEEARQLLSLHDLSPLEWAKKLNHYAPSVLLKGGHGPGTEITDYLSTTSGVKTFKHPRRKLHSSRGTGCRLASGIASYLAQGFTLEEAITQSIQLILLKLPFHAGDDPESRD